MESQVEEKRIFLVALDELDGIIGREVGVVLHMTVMGIGLDVNEFVVVESIIGIIIGRVGMDGRDGPTIEFVKTSVIGRRTGVVTVEVPFIHQTGAVARTA